jgi:hypothetical protein
MCGRDHVRAQKKRRLGIFYAFRLADCRNRVDARVANGGLPLNRLIVLPAMDEAAACEQREESFLA